MHAPLHQHSAQVPPSPFFSILLAPHASCSSEAAIVVGVAFLKRLAAYTHVSVWVSAARKSVPACLFQHAVYVPPYNSLLCVPHMSSSTGPLHCVIRVDLSQKRLDLLAVALS